MSPAGEEGLVRILDVEPDLARGLDEEAVKAATGALLAQCLRLEWTTQRDGWGPSDPTGHLGLMVVEGLLLREVRVLGTYSAELLAQGDILRPWDADGELHLPVPAEISWSALEPVSVAVLDAKFVRRAGSWPVVISGLASHAVVRTMSMALNHAITNLTRVDLRLLLLFWHLATRWGRVSTDTIVVPLPLTHETLAKLVGAARPSVTTALGSLAERRLLQREEGVWLLSRDAGETFA